MTGFWVSFFLGFLHHIGLAILAISSIRVKLHYSSLKRSTLYFNRKILIEIELVQSLTLLRNIFIVIITRFGIINCIINTESLQKQSSTID